LTNGNPGPAPLAGAAVADMTLTSPSVPRAPHPDSFRPALHTEVKFDDVKHRTPENSQATSMSLQRNEQSNLSTKSNSSIAPSASSAASGSAAATIRPAGCLRTRTRAANPALRTSARRAAADTDASLAACISANRLAARTPCDRTASSVGAGSAHRDDRCVLRGRQGDM
jgi:hypothetical protein